MPERPPASRTELELQLRAVDGFLNLYTGWISRARGAINAANVAHSKRPSYKAMVAVVEGLLVELQGLPTNRELIHGRLDKEITRLKPEFSAEVQQRCAAAFRQLEDACRSKKSQRAQAAAVRVLGLSICDVIDAGLMPARQLHRRLLRKLRRSDFGVHSQGPQASVEPLKEKRQRLCFEGIRDGKCDKDINKALADSGLEPYAHRQGNLRAARAYAKCHRLTLSATRRHVGS